VDGRVERREPSMGITSTVGAPGIAPVIDVLAGVMDSDEVTSIVTTSVVLSVMRSLDLDTRPPSAAIPALTGTWSGQPDPVVLALATRR
jgi:hypothetical protein